MCRVRFLRAKHPALWFDQPTALQRYPKRRFPHLLASARLAADWGPRCSSCPDTRSASFGDERRGLFYYFVLHREFPDNLLQIVGRFAWLIALSMSFLLGITLIMEAAFRIGLTLFSPAMQHRAAHPELLAHFFLRGIPLHTFQNHF